MQKRIYFLLLLGLMISGVQAWAAGPGRDMNMPDRAEIEAALEECISSLESDTSDRPDISAVDSCMSAKGYSKPSAPPGGMGGEGRGGPPPDRN